MAKGTKRTYQPSTRRRARRYGFLKRQKSGTVIQGRRRKGRRQLSPAA